jgi:hypothetical protein
LDDVTETCPGWIEIPVPKDVREREFSAVRLEKGGLALYVTNNVQHKVSVPSERLDDEVEALQHTTAAAEPEKLPFRRHVVRWLLDRKGLRD